MDRTISFIAAHPDFAELFLSWREEEEMKKYNPLASSSLESLRERLTKASSDFNDFDKADSYFWFIGVSGEKAGHLSVQNVNRMMLTAEIGYGIAASARSRGIASTAVRILCEQAFARTPLRKLIAFVHEENFPSIRVLENVGFKNEGLLRKHYLVNGVPTNELIYGLLREDLS